jgi:hypothetical protein
MKGDRIDVPHYDRNRLLNLRKEKDICRQTGFSIFDDKV